jgi:hypothetical protein
MDVSIPIFLPQLQLMVILNSRSDEADSLRVVQVNASAPADEHRSGQCGLCLRAGCQLPAGTAVT